MDSSFPKIFVANNFGTCNKLGLGDLQYASAIDLSRLRYLVDGQNTLIDGLEHKVGTIVRTEDFGNTLYEYVNDKLVVTASTTRDDGVVYSRGYMRSHPQEHC